MVARRRVRVLTRRRRADEEIDARRRHRKSELREILGRHPAIGDVHVVGADGLDEARAHALGQRGIVVVDRIAVERIRARLRNVEIDGRAVRRGDVLAMFSRLVSACWRIVSSNARTVP